MKDFFSKSLRNFLKIFSGYNLIWHVLAIVLTYFIVFSGFDWKYFEFLRGTPVYYFFFSAAVIGGLIPLLAPVIMAIWFYVKKNSKNLNLSLALLQAAMLGSIISSLYKTFTGRMPPELVLNLATTDISRMFRFGFLRGGIFWGWPSSHATIAFAMATTLIILFPGNKKVRYFSIAYALFIGVGVSMTIHWFSDFVAGAIIGTVIGVVVGKSYFAKLSMSA